MPEAEITEAAATLRSRTPRHLWLVGVLALLWSGMGALDYLMAQTKNEAWLARFTPEQLDFFQGIPSWVVAFWAIGVWGGVLGAILLLLRKRLAAWAFLASFLGAVVTTVRNFFLANALEACGPPAAVFAAVVLIIALGLFLYARWMTKRGVLR